MLCVCLLTSALAAAAAMPATAEADVRLMTSELAAATEKLATASAATVRAKEAATVAASNFRTLSSLPPVRQALQARKDAAGLCVYVCMRGQGTLLQWGWWCGGRECGWLAWWQGAGGGGLA